MRVEVTRVERQWGKVWKDVASGRRRRSKRRRDTTEAVMDRDKGLVGAARCRRLGKDNR